MEEVAMNGQDNFELRDIFLFRLLSDEEFRELSKSWRERKYKAGTKIFSEGILGEAMYIVVSGSVKITRAVNGREKELVTLRSGEFFGEIAMLEYVSRTASATTLTEVSLMEVTREEFNGLLSESPNIAAKLLYQMIIEMSKRLRYANYSAGQGGPVVWV